MWQILQMCRTACRRDEDAFECLRPAGVLECFYGAPRPFLRVFAAAEMVDERAAATGTFQRHQLVTAPRQTATHRLIDLRRERRLNAARHESDAFGIGKNGARRFGRE